VDRLGIGCPKHEKNDLDYLTERTGWVIPTPQAVELGLDLLQLGGMMISSGGCQRGSSSP
jgi:hypothetical protein